MIEPGSWDPPPLRGSSSRRRFRERASGKEILRRSPSRSRRGSPSRRDRGRPDVRDVRRAQTPGRVRGESVPPGRVFHQARGGGKPRANPEGVARGRRASRRGEGAVARVTGTREGEEEEREEEDGGSGAGRRGVRISVRTVMMYAELPEREPARGPSSAAAAAAAGGGGGRGRTTRGRGRRGVRARGVWLAWRGTLGRSRVCVARRRTGRTRRGRRARRAGRRSGVGVSCSGTWTPARRVRGSSEKGEGPAGVDSTFIIINTFTVYKSKRQSRRHRVVVVLVIRRRGVDRETSWMWRWATGRSDDIAVVRDRGRGRLNN